MGRARCKMENDESGGVIRSGNATFNTVGREFLHPSTFSAAIGAFAASDYGAAGSFLFPKLALGHAMASLDSFYDTIDLALERNVRTLLYRYPMGRGELTLWEWPVVWLRWLVL